MKMLVLAACLLTACQPKMTEPVDIAPDDTCSFCRMAISEKRLAAEFWSRDTALYKFDDVACMVNHLKRGKGRQDIQACFVMDYDARRWLRAEEAYYVRSPQIKTPMGGGIIAFADRSSAEATASRYQGQMLRFDEFF